jgi:hypothetical protein
MKTLLCTRCKQEKAVTSFSRASHTRGYSYHCKECVREKSREHYHSSNKEVVFGRAKQRVYVVQEALNKLKSEYGCYYCPESESACLDFHHINETEKSDSISKLAKVKSLAKLAPEISKCIVVCANCHRKIHAGLINPKNVVKCSVSEDDLRLRIPFKKKPASKQENNKLNNARQKRGVCVDCGKFCNKESDRCRVCFDIVRKNKKKPTKEQIILDLQALKTYTALAGKYDVHSATIVRWLESYSLK